MADLHQGQTGPSQSRRNLVRLTNFPRGAPPTCCASPTSLLPLCIKKAALLRTCHTDVDESEANTFH
ncbi:hypothetical protein COLO4_10691 [Corchorus olitorius]|uniref:Uncharacterized protein n=1 Tax=Corchorus olitorius TaxID=93759 RepID=A0A1R3K7B8_9ROSI|nr:hypothetical protein COLO4_10691 [Corchorus olitorius]